MERIGRHVYAFLKSIPKNELTEDQKAQLSDYEEGKNEHVSEEQKQFRKDYFERLLKEDVYEEITITKDQLWRDFNSVYYQDNGVFFSTDKDSIENLKVVFSYFLKDDSFFECSRLIKDLNDPSFEKGLLIIGSYGNGKTSIMKALYKCLMNYKNYSFACYDANDLVNDYEACEDSVSKDSFWRKLTSGRAYFDDVKTERQASNYGKVNLFKDILERRNARSLITHMTGNYTQDKSNDLMEALREYGTKYGSRVYDRLFSDFNIIEFKGKSFRR